MTHLWLGDRYEYVSSECELHFPRVRRDNLTTLISQATCWACVEARHKRMCNDLKACSDRLVELGSQ